MQARKRLASTLLVMYAIHVNLPGFRRSAQTGWGNAMAAPSSTARFRAPTKEHARYTIPPASRSRRSLHHQLLMRRYSVIILHSSDNWYPSVGSGSYQGDGRTTSSEDSRTEEAGCSSVATQPTNGLSWSPASGSIEIIDSAIPKDPGSNRVYRLPKKESQGKSSIDAEEDRSKGPMEREKTHTVTVRWPAAFLQALCDERCPLRIRHRLGHNAFNLRPPKA